MLGLGFPGGPAIEDAARKGNPRAFELPRAWLHGTHDFSFSGLKTALLRLTEPMRVPESDREPGITSPTSPSGPFGHIRRRSTRQTPHRRSRRRLPGSDRRAAGGQAREPRSSSALAPSFSPAA